MCMSCGINSCDCSGFPLTVPEDFNPATISGIQYNANGTITITLSNNQTYTTSNSITFPQPVREAYVLFNRSGNNAGPSDASFNKAIFTIPANTLQLVSGVSPIVIIEFAAQMLVNEGFNFTLKAGSNTDISFPISNYLVNEMELSGRITIVNRGGFPFYKTDLHLGRINQSGATYGRDNVFSIDDSNNPITSDILITLSNTNLASEFANFYYTVVTVIKPF